MTNGCTNGVHRSIVVTVVGAFQNGKSTLVNCLLDDKYAPMGNGTRTTACCTYFRYGAAEIAKLFHSAKEVHILERREAIFESSFKCCGTDWLEISCWKPILQKAILVDTPGFDANEEDDAVAQNAIDKSDIVIFVHDARQLDDCAFRILRNIQDSGKRLLFLMNCKNQQNWHPSDKKNLEIAQVIESQLSENGFDASLIRINGRKVWPCNPLFAWYALGHLQRDLDSGQENVKNDANDLMDDIKHFCKKKKWKNLYEQKEQFMTGSGILEVRDTIERASMASLWYLCGNLNAELQALTETWSARLKKIILESEAMSRK